MNKTEHDIAKENIEEKRKTRLEVIFNICKKHKQTCQRFLVYLEKQRSSNLFKKVNAVSIEAPFVLELNDKITDLRNAIKLYEEEGI